MMRSNPLRPTDSQKPWIRRPLVCLPGPAAGEERGEQMATGESEHRLSVEDTPEESRVDSGGWGWEAGATESNGNPKGLKLLIPSDGRISTLEADLAKTNAKVTKQEDHIQSMQTDLTQARSDLDDVQAKPTKV